MAQSQYLRKVSRYAFGLALAVFVIVDYYVSPGVFPEYTVQKLVLEVFSAIGVYEILFHSMSWMYSTYLYKKFDKRLDMSGKWYQIITISGAKSLGESIRHGPCIITSNPNLISISGENNKADSQNSPSSNWQSDVATLSNRELLVLYHSEGAQRRVHIHRRGTMVFQVLGDPPEKLVGQWSDVIPGKNSGAIEIFRDESMYRHRLKTKVEGQVRR